MTWSRIALYYAAAALLLALYVLVVDRTRSLPAHARGKAAEPLVDLSPSQVTALEVRRGGRRVRCERRAGRWRVVDPAGGKVPPDLIEALVDNLTGGAEMDVVGDASSGRALFGLDRPRGALVLEAPGERALLLVGEKNPTRTAVYMMREGDARVFLGGLNVEYYQELLLAAAYPTAGPR